MTNQTKIPCSSCQKPTTGVGGHEGPGEGTCYALCPECKAGQQQPERPDLESIGERAKAWATYEDKKLALFQGIQLISDDIPTLTAYVRALEASMADNEKALAVLGTTNARHTVTIQASEDTEDRLRRELSLSTARSFDLEAQLAEANAKRPCDEPEGSATASSCPNPACMSGVVFCPICSPERPQTPRPAEPVAMVKCPVDICSGGMLKGYNRDCKVCNGLGEVPAKGEDS